MADANRSGAKRGRGRPAKTPEEREKQLQNMAYDVLEEQLKSGKVSSQLLTLLIKGGSAQGALEMENLRNQNRLLNARVENMEAATKVEESIEAALIAFRTYQGEPIDEFDD